MFRPLALLILAARPVLAQLPDSPGHQFAMVAGFDQRYSLTASTTEIGPRLGLAWRPNLNTRMVLGVGFGHTFVVAGLQNPPLPAPQPSSQRNTFILRADYRFWEFGPRSKR